MRGPKILKRTWRERVARAERTGKFTDNDMDLAENWRTCAVGEQAAHHPQVVLAHPNCMKRGYDFTPLDAELIRLGELQGGFADAVRHHDVGMASQLLDAIEDRVLQLKRGAPEGA